MKIDISNLFNKLDYNHLSPNVWRIKQRGRLLPHGVQKYNESKQMLLELILAGFGNNFLIYDEDMSVKNSKRPLQKITSDTWLIPKGVRGDEFYSKLYLGNWAIYSAPEVCVIEDILNAFIKKPTVVCDLLIHKKINAVLFAYHDNEPWYFASQTMATNSER